MNVPKNRLEEILGVSLRARHKENNHGPGPLTTAPIIHKQIHGSKVYTPLKRELWNI